MRKTFPMIDETYSTFWIYHQIPMYCLQLNHFNHFLVQYVAENEFVGKKVHLGFTHNEIDYERCKRKNSNDNVQVCETILVVSPCPKEEIKEVFLECMHKKQPHEVEIDCETEIREIA